MGHFIIPMELIPIQPSQAGTAGHPSLVHALSTGMKREEGMPEYLITFLPAGLALSCLWIILLGLPMPLTQAVLQGLVVVTPTLIIRST